MQVNVFVIPRDSENKLLVLPMSPDAAIPPQFQKGWFYYASVSSGDALFGDVDATTIEDGIAASGFALVSPEVPNRR